MLKYLWTVIQDLFVTVTLVTWIHAVLGKRYDRFGRRFHGAGIIVGVLAAIARAAYRMSEEGKTGAFTILDIAPAQLSPLSKDELLAHIV